VTSLDKVFILRHFTKEEMDTPLSKPLQDELLWEGRMAEKTKALYTVLQPVECASNVAS
jgi:hypothetical protein